MNLVNLTNLTNLIKKHIVSILFLLIAFIAGKISNIQVTKAQTTANAITIYGGGPVSTCAKPVTNTTFICVGTDDIIGSKSGGAVVSLFPSSVVAGISQLTVNGTPCTGPTCIITIPTKVTINPVTPTGTIQ